MSSTNLAVLRARPFADKEELLAPLPVWALALAERWIEVWWPPVHRTHAETRVLQRSLARLIISGAPSRPLSKALLEKASSEDTPSNLFGSKALSRISPRE